MARIAEEEFSDVRGKYLVTFIQFNFNICSNFLESDLVNSPVVVVSDSEDDDGPSTRASEELCSGNNCGIFF